jgi:hypothetical protein
MRATIDENCVGPSKPPPNAGSAKSQNGFDVESRIRLLWFAQEQKRNTHAYREATNDKRCS